MLKFSSDPDVAEQQMNAIIFYLTAFGYIDGHFAPVEKIFIRTYIRQLVASRADDAMPGADEKTRGEVIDKFVGHFHEVFEHVDRGVRAFFDEAVSAGENVETFVSAKLKLRAFEIFHGFDATNQRVLLDTLDELIHADGEVHEAEAKFRAELDQLLHAAAPAGAAAPAPLLPAIPVEVAQAAALVAQADDHPFFQAFEGEHYSLDPERLHKQAEADFALIERFRARLADERRLGAGRLGGRRHVGEFAGTSPFLDGHVHVHPVAANKRYELTVLGDLHGCYSCLKAALMQSDFLAKVAAYRKDPQALAEPKLIFLGDYIDRGRFSYNGVLRAVMELYLAAPEHVYVLRGNHEYYIEYNGRIYGGVKPAEAINTLVGHLPGQYFEAYMRLFEDLPNLLLFDRLCFVHAGIPRDKDLAAKYQDLASLNDADLRFQMLWSDPSSVDHIPDELQAQNARFPFGKLQFEDFMQRIGCTTMVRGHEKIDEGFRDVYPGSPIRLLNLFSAGGGQNADLPESSSYRTVTPMAATIHVDLAAARVVPWAIDYQRYNAPERNRFFATAPEIAHKAD